MNAVDAPPLREEGFQRGFMAGADAPPRRPRASEQDPGEEKFAGILSRDDVERSAPAGGAL